MNKAISKQLFISLALACAVTIVAPNFAQALTSCYGTITEVDVSGSGWLYVTMKGSDVDIYAGRICSLYSDTTEVKQESCKSWQALLTAAKLSGKPVKLYMRQGTCSPSGWAQLFSSAFGAYHLRLDD